MKFAVPAMLLGLITLPASAENLPWFVGGWSCQTSTRDAQVVGHSYFEIKEDASAKQTGVTSVHSDLSHMPDRHWESKLNLKIADNQLTQKVVSFNPTLGSTKTLSAADKHFQKVVMSNSPITSNITVIDPNIFVLSNANAVQTCLRRN